jgi:hypothetical protein
MELPCEKCLVSSICKLQILKRGFGVGQNGKMYIDLKRQRTCDSLSNYIFENPNEIARVDSRINIFVQTFLGIEI